MRRATTAGWLLLLGLSGAAFAAEKTAAHYVPADAWLVVWYDGTHPGLAETPLARFLKEPEVQDALKGLQPALDKLLEEGNKEAGFDLAPVLREALGCELVLAFLGPAPGRDEPTGLIVARVGTGDAPARRHTEALVKLLLASARQNTVRQVELAGIQATAFVGKDGEPSALGFDGSFLVIANGEELFKRAVDPAAPKLAEKVGGERAIFRLRYDHTAMLKAFGNQMKPEVRRVLEGIGLQAVSAAELAFVPREKRMAASLAIDLPAGANRQGLLRGLADAASYDPAMLRFVPRDAMAFWLGNIDFAWAWDELWATLGRVDANAANEARQGLAKLEEAAGLKVRDGLLAPLGQGTLFVSKPEGAVGGWTAIVQRMRDPDAFEKAFGRLATRLDVLLMGLPNVGAVRTELKTFQYRGHTCRYLWMMGTPAIMLPYWTPCYARLGNEIVFATNPLQLKGFLDFVEDKGPTIQENGEFQALLAEVPKGATSVGYTAWRNGIEAAYNTLAPLLAFVQGIPELQGRPDLANLPSSRLVRRYFVGTIGYTVFEKGRFRAETLSEGIDAVGPHLLTIGGLAIPAAVFLGYAKAEPPAPVEVKPPPPVKVPEPKGGPAKGEF